MEDARNRAMVPVTNNGFARGTEITLAEMGWPAYGQELDSRVRRGKPEDQFRRLTPGTHDESSPWKAADRALAEITAANRSGLYSSPKERARLERATAILRESLLEAAQAAADAARRARALAETLDEVVAALADPRRGQMTAMPALAASTAGAPSQLSQREREVLARVAAGRSNKAIAEELFVSPNTVKTHVASLLRKLDVHTRAQLATIAVQQGLTLAI
jgi:DNA-binding CsgD family transcriptional regulator